MEIILITGISGAGKSKSLSFLEDFGYFTIDNFPPMFLESFIEILQKKHKNIDKVAFSCDVRSRFFFSTLEKEIQKLLNKGIECKIIFLKASQDVIIKRFKEHKKTHTLDENNNLIEAIKEEKKLLENILNTSDYIIDTSNLSTWDLKDKLKSLLFGTNTEIMNLRIVSFAYKKGIPQDSDLVFDVRFINNPYYVSELKDKVGTDKDVSEYVFKDKRAVIFTDKIIDIINFSLKEYQKEGKNNLVLSIGCTGGKHRSVAIAERIYKSVSTTWDNISISHREVN